MEVVPPPPPRRRRRRDGRCRRRPPHPSAGAIKPELNQSLAPSCTIGWVGVPQVLDAYEGGTRDGRRGRRGRRRRAWLGVEEVEEHGEEGTGCIDPQCYPPDELLMQLLLKVLEHQQTNGESSESPRQMGHVRHWMTHLLRRVTTVDCKSNVRTRDYNNSY